MENLENPQHLRPVINIFGNINNYNVYEAPVSYQAPVNNYNGITNAALPKKEKHPVPKFDEMMQTFKKASEDGLWQSMRSWGVGFQMWQIWGYEGTIQDYVKMVNQSPDYKTFDYQCNEDAVYKMISKGHLSRRLENWRIDGVLEHHCLLGEMINKELLKLYPEDQEVEELLD